MRVGYDVGWGCRVGWVGIRRVTEMFSGSVMKIQNQKLKNQINNKNQ